VACQPLSRPQLASLIFIERKSNRQLWLPGLRIVNEGVRELPRRRYVVAIAHSSKLRHPPGPILVVCNGRQIVGEEAWRSSDGKGTSTESDVIYLGRGLKFYRKGLERSRGKELKVCYRGLRFPELEAVKGVRDVVSVTVNTQTHMHIARLFGRDENNPDLGTVLIGFN